MSSLADNLPMNLDTSFELQISNAFDDHLAASQGSPEWWTQFKKDAFATFGKTPMPSRKDEYWRFSNLKGLDLTTFEFGQQPLIEDAQEIIEQSNILCQHAGSYVFADNQTVHMQRAAEELREKGVIWCTLREAVKHHGELLQDYFMKQEADIGSEKFAALHSAFVESGVLLYVPKGVEIEDPFVTYNWSVSDKSSIFPHTLVITEEFAKVQVVEAQFSQSAQTQGLSCGVTHLFAGVGSKIDYTLLQNYNEQTLGFQINSNIVGKDARIKTTAVNVGCRQYRAETHGRIMGEGAHVDMFSLAVTDAKQEIDQRTLQTHSAAHATSNLLFKNALLNDSKTIFSGLIKVDECAQQTDAYQTNRNLLLSRAAEANSLPGLEIEANDVKCSHGATTSQIEDEEIFYMLARGIPRNKAQELIVYGFFEEILEQLDNESLAENARRIIQTKFKQNA